MSATGGLLCLMTCEDQMPRHPVPVYTVPVKQEYNRLAERYAAVRTACTELSQLLGCQPDFTDQELKRIDHAMVLLRMGYKGIKRVIRKRGAIVGRVKLKERD